MNRAIRRVGTAVIVLLLLLVGAAHVPAGHRRQEAGRRPPQLPHVPRGLHPAARRDHQRRRQDPRPVGPVRTTSTSCQRVYPFGELFAQIVGYQSVVVGSTGVEQEYNDVLSGRDTSRLRLQRPRRPPARQGADRQRRAQPAHRRAARGQGRARQPAGLGRRARPDAPGRSSRCTRTRASTRSRSRATTRRPCRRTGDVAATRQPRQPAAAARVPRALPTGLDVQDRRRPRPRSTPASPTPSTPFPMRALVHAAAGRPADRELRRRAAAAGRSRRAS